MANVFFQAAGVFLNLIGPFKQVYDFLKSQKETQDIDARLKVVLEPLKRYKESVEASEESARLLRSKVDQLKEPFSVLIIEELAKGMTKFSIDFDGVLSGVLGFSKQCSILMSDFESFMQKVRKKKPEVYDIMTFFGRHYDPKTNSLDLANLPTFISVNLPQLRSNGDSDEESLLAQVSEGGRSVDRAIRAARAISHQRISVKDRQVRKELTDAFKKMLSDLARFRATADVSRELTKEAPPWLVELSKILDRVQKVLPGLWKPEIHRYQRARSFKTGSREYGVRPDLSVRRRQH